MTRKRKLYHQFLCKGPIVVFSLLLVGLSCDRGEVIETIGGHPIHTKEYENYYATSVDLASRMAGADKTFVSRMVCNDSSSLGTALEPSQHYSRYRDALMVARVAEEEGFLDDPHVQRMLEQSRLQTIGQLYINAKLLQKVKIPPEARLEVCEALRKKEPEKMAHLSLDDCLEVAEGVLKRRMVSEKGEEVVNDIKEKIAIKKNNKFDTEGYLKSLSLYKTLRKKGGCADEPEAEPGKSKKDASSSTKKEKQ